MLRNISLWQILIVVLIIVLLFGARRLPELASSLGKSLKIFKKEVTELREDDDAPPVHGTSAATPDTGTTGHKPVPPGNDVPPDGPGAGPR